jgi:hypothetical protein
MRRIDDAKTAENMHPYILYNRIRQIIVNLIPTASPRNLQNPKITSFKIAPAPNPPRFAHRHGNSV